MKRQSLILIIILILVICAGSFGCGGINTGSNGDQTPNTIEVVQSAGLTAGCLQISGCDSQSLKLPNAVANGDFIAVLFSWSESNVNGSAVVTVTDSESNNYTSIGPSTNFSCGESTLCYVFYAKNVTGGNNFTVQTSLANGGGFGFNMAVLDVKGATTFDLWNSGGCSLQNGCTTYTTDQFQVTHADELLVSVASLQDDCTAPGCAIGFQIGAGTGFTEVYSQTYFAAEYMVTATPGAYQGTFTSNDLGVGNMICAAFY